MTDNAVSPQPLNNVAIHSGVITSRIAGARPLAHIVFALVVDGEEELVGEGLLDVDREFVEERVGAPPGLDL